MDQLTYRARNILAAYEYHEPDTVIAFWDVLIDEDGNLWTQTKDSDAEQLVELAFLRPVPQGQPSAFLRAVAREQGLRLHPRRVWQLTETFKKVAA